MKINVFIPILLYSDALIRMTEQSIKHARENTSMPFELILLENKTEVFKGDADTYIHTNHYNHYSRNANICINAAYDADFVVGLATDAFMPEHWLEHLFECFVVHDDCGVSTLNSSEDCIPCCDQIREDIGACVYMESRKFIDAVGDWDEEYHNSHEDYDLFVRGYMKGFKVYKNMKVLAEHIGGQTWKHQKEHDARCLKNKARFNEKFEGCDIPLFDMLR